MKIKGKIRNLQNRKFCIICSPFGSGNTKPDNPKRPSLRREYKYWANKRKRQYKNTLLKRAYARKQKLVLIFGGKCKICGYNKCLRALAFRHRKRKNKIFRLCADYLWSRPWKAILKEAKKCDLVCLCCVAELEDKLFSERKKQYLDKF
jgi:hypothetical protein